MRLELRNLELAKNVYEWLLVRRTHGGGGGGDVPKSPSGARRSSVERSDPTTAEHAREKLKLLVELSAAGASGGDGGTAAMV